MQDTEEYSYIQLRNYFVFIIRQYYKVVKEIEGEKIYQSLVVDFNVGRLQVSRNRKTNIRSRVACHQRKYFNVRLFLKLQWQLY